MTIRSQPVYLRRPERSSLLEIERPLPQDITAERAVLGAVLLDNHTINTTIEKLRPEDFFHDHHKRLFAQIIIMFEAALPIDLVTLCDQLRRKGKLEDAGGPAYIAELVDGVPRVSHLEHYARIVKEKSVLRGLVRATQAIQRNALEAEEDPDTILANATASISNLCKSSASKSGLMVYTAPELAVLSPEPIEYIAYPFAARGMVALLDGAPKASGKTTLMMTAVGASSRRQLFLNHPTKSTRILYVTEENQRTFNLVVARAGLATEPNLHIIPFNSFFGLPWPQLAQEIERLCINLKIDWLIIDTFYAVAGLGGEEENKAGTVDAAVAPLRAIAGRLDIALTLSRHERKSGGEVGNSGRGSIALTGAVDIVSLLKRLPGNQAFSPQRRRLELAGRVEQATLTIELREDGRYIVVDTAAENATDEGDLLTKAIDANPTASIRELEKATGIGRNRIVKVAAKAGFVSGDSGWQRGGN